MKVKNLPSEKEQNIILYQLMEEGGLKEKEWTSGASLLGLHDSLQY